MNNDRQLKTRRAIIIVAAVFFIALCALIVVFFLSTRNQNMVRITNIDSCAEHLPSSDRDRVFRQLFSFVEAQNQVIDEVTQPSYTAEIRADTCATKDYPSGGTEVTNARFILDIPVAQQSYRVSFSWIKTGNPASTEVDLGATGVNCLRESDLIYGEFACDKNPLITATNAAGDPLLALLPYFGDGFSLSPATSSDSASGYSIILTFDPPETIYQNGPFDTYLEERRVLMRQLLADHDIDIDDYNVIENFKVN